METYTKESILRDLIAQKIQKLKPDLTLLQKEQYIPNEYGTKSFIDLYATDEEKRHVLIELKRSDAAARQAIHEVNKYVESVKRHFGAKDSLLLHPPSGQNCFCHFHAFTQTLVFLLRECR